MQQLLRDPGALAESRFAANRVKPEPPERLKQLHRLADLLAQLTRARVRGLDLVRAETLHLRKRGAERREQPQFVPHPGAVGRELAYELQALPEIGDGFAVRRALHGSGPSFLEIGEGLVRHFASPRVVRAPLDTAT